MRAWTLLFLLSCSALLSQVEERTLAQSVQPSDSTIILQFSAEDPHSTSHLNDSTLGPSFFQYDPSRQHHQAILGNLGSASNPLLFNYNSRGGFRSGFNQFSIYMIPNGDIPFYEVKKAYTHLFFNQQSQDNLNLDIRFSRNFGSGTNLSLTYNRINQVGLYRRQRLRNTRLGIGFMFQSVNKKYQAFFSHASNEILNQENGGISSPDILTSSSGQNREVVPVQLSDASTRYEERWMTFIHFLKIKAGPVNKDNFTDFVFKHRAKLLFGRYKYTDEFLSISMSSDSAFYGDFYTDPRGLTLYMKFYSLQNEFSLQLNRWKSRALNDWLHLGILHQFWNLNYIPANQRLNDLALTGSWQNNLLNNIMIGATGKVFILGHTGDFDLEGYLSLDLNRGGQINGKLNIFSKSPSIIEESLVINREKIWDFSFSRTTGVKITGSYEIEAINTSVVFSSTLLDNFIFMDQNRRPAQVNEAFNITQIGFQNTLKAGILGLNSSVMYQVNTNENVLRFPEFVVSADLFAAFVLFRRNMKGRLGIDFNGYSSFLQNGYFPLTGQFHLQDGEESGLIPLVDVYFSFGIGSFRGFLKLENLMQAVTDDIYYLVPGYPLFDSRIRLGLAWRLWD